MVSFYIIFYIALLGFSIFRWRFFSIEPIPKMWVILTFIVKAVVAIIYGQVMWEMHDTNSDTWAYFVRSGYFLDTLFSQPAHFFELYFGPYNYEPPPEYLKVYINQLSFWRDPSAYLTLKVVTLLRVFCFGSYHAIAVVWAYLSMVGSIGIYKAFRHFHQQNPRLLFAMLFLTPSIMFWGSGIHKDGLSIFFVGLILVQLLTILKGEKGRWRWILLIVLGYFLFQLRPYVAMILMLCSTGLLVLKYWPHQAFIKYLALFALGLLGISLLGHFSSQYNIYTSFVEVQSNLMTYGAGDSDIEIAILEPNVGSFIQHSPAAINNTLFRPYLWDGSKITVLVSAIENLLLLIFVILALIFNQVKQIRNRSWFWFCIFFSITLFIVIGLVVPNLGAIVRYRTLAMIFWLGAWAMIIDEEKVLKVWNKIFSRRINIKQGRGNL